ncbi:MAG: dihydroorotate dehydrogenase [Treponema sp.]|jgi:dihydroorotate dehydrogenase (NAD+) catalytic subunit|nr:dihydroorotate dehydrogenase [Treponema sp.]
MSDALFETTEKKPDLSLKIAGVHFRNPVIAASGTFGCGKEYAPFFDISLLGGICSKGLTITPRPGNTGIRIWETPSGLLNSIGLENPGIPVFLERDLPYLKQSGAVIIANLSGAESSEYIRGAELLNESSVDMIELNISCPNVKAGGMAFGLDPGTAAALVAAVRRVCVSKPLIVKLSPNAPSIGTVALACIRAGADALSLVNSFKAMAIDVTNKKPVFDFTTSGLSGPAIKPIALRMVWELYDTLKESNMQVPIIGIGGISCANDALEFLMAGACAVQVGSATLVNPYTMTDIISGIIQYMQNNGIFQIGKISIRN